MKILLIWVPFKLEEIYGKLSMAAPILPPLELAYMASYSLLRGHEVKVIDAHALGLDFDDIERIIRQERPDLVGTTTNSPIFSFIYSVYSRSLELLRLVKKINPSIKTFLSGYHATISPEEVLSNECVDYILRGEGEITLSQLSFALGQNKDLNDIDGLGFKKDGKIIINKERDFIKDLDILPINAYSLLPINKYRFASGSPVPSKGIAIRASRGCSFNCYFCSTPAMWKETARFHSPGYVFSLMKYIHKHYKINKFQFHDENFNINKRWITEFCDLLVKNNRKFDWECYSRFDLLEERQLIAMKNAGCRLISLGVETGSDEVVRKIKGFGQDKIENGMRLLKKLGIKTRLFFMIGPPSTTDKMIDDTIKYAIRLDPDIFIATISIPFPGSKFYDDMKKENRIPNFEDKLIPLYEAPCDSVFFTKENLNRSIKQAYRRFYIRPKFILKQMKYLRPLNLVHYIRCLINLFK